MKRRQWDAKAKARIVLEGLQGKPVADSVTSIRSTRGSIISGATNFWRMLQRPLRSIRTPRKTRAWRGRMPG
jgi:hypothetical protein